MLSIEAARKLEAAHKFEGEASVVKSVLEEPEGGRENSDGAEHERQEEDDSEGSITGESASSQGGTGLNANGKLNWDTVTSDLEKEYKKKIRELVLENPILLLTCGL